MKAIPSSSSPPPPPPPPPSSLRSSRSYSSLTGGHASPACFGRRRFDVGESRVKFVVVTAKKKKPSSSSSSSQEFQKRNSGIPKPATSYRRKKLPKEDLLDDDMEL